MSVDDDEYTGSTSLVTESVLANIGSVRASYQPVVELGTCQVIGYEALARWPAYPDADVTDVFGTASTRGLLGSLDWACRLAAIEGAVDAGLRAPYRLFVNIEPTSGVSTEHSVRERLRDIRRRAVEGFVVVAELTERSLLADPATLLSVVADARRLGCEIALDDVGADPGSLAMLEFVAPDIIKLDRALVQNTLTAADGRTVAAVSAYIEATGATLLAEGIETPAHLTRARALGATLGQGWMFGRPASLAAEHHVDELSWSPAPRSPREMTSDDIPAVPSDLFEHRAPSIGDKALLLTMARGIEDFARAAGEQLTVQSAFQRSRWFAPNVVERYAALAAKHPFVAAVGAGLSPEPAPGVRGAGLDPSERFAREWTVTAVGAHYFAALIARDIGDTDRPDADRRFEFILTHDRHLVVAAARSLMARVLPLSH
jgi:EAL domain-containing protein (putative c-di-GMP-specific phosphodiesterase class I)